MTALKVSDLMQEHVHVLRASDDMDLAATIMRLERYRHMPVVSKSQVVGIVSDRDILRAHASNLANLSAADRHAEAMQVPVSRIMSTDVITVGPDEPAVTAAERLEEHKVDCLPVVRDGDLVGIITATDFLKLVIKELSDPGA